MALLNIEIKRGSTFSLKIKENLSDKGNIFAIRNSGYPPSEMAVRAAYTFSKV